MHKIIAVGLGLDSVGVALIRPAAVIRGKFPTDVPASSSTRTAIYSINVLLQTPPRYPGKPSLELTLDLMLLIDILRCFDCVAFLTQDRAHASEIVL